MDAILMQPLRQKKKKDRSIFIPDGPLNDLGINEKEFDARWDALAEALNCSGRGEILVRLLGGQLLSRQPVGDTDDEIVILQIKRHR